MELLPNWVFLVGAVTLRDIRAGIFGLPVGFRTHEDSIGAPVAGGTVMVGLRTSGAHASGQKGDVGDG